MNEGDYQQAERLVRGSIELSQRVKNHWMEAMCYLGLIGVELAQGKYKEAGQHSQEIQSIYQDVKEQGRSIMLLSILQISAWARGDFEEAVRMGNQILDLIPEFFLDIKDGLLLPGQGGAVSA